MEARFYRNPGRADICLISGQSWVRITRQYAFNPQNTNCSTSVNCGCNTCHNFSICALSQQVDTSGDNNSRTRNWSALHQSVAGLAEADSPLRSCNANYCARRESLSVVGEKRNYLGGLLNRDHSFRRGRICSKTTTSTQFRNTKHWPLTKGVFSGNYEDGGERVIYYGYKVGDSHYSGFVAAGSTISRDLKSRLDALKGKPALIRYKPDQPEISTLFQSDQIEAKL